MNDTEVNDTEVMLRRARSADATALLVLAELDSARPLEGEILLAEIDGELRAAHSLADGRTISDPFSPASAARELLAVHARQVATGKSRFRRRGRHFRARHVHPAL